MKTEQNLSVWPCVHIAPLWKRSFSKTLMKTHKFENGAFWKRTVFSVNTKNGDIWKRFTSLCQNNAFVSSCQEGTNAIMPLYSIAFQQRNLKRFQMSPILVLTLKTDRFQNAPFSNLCVFISVFEKLRFHSGAMRTQGQNGQVLFRFHMKTEQNSSIWPWRWHCSAVETEIFENANENV